MTDARPRVAIVGAGAMGRWHAAAARRAGASLEAAVDLDRAKAAALSAAATFDDVAQALAARPVEVAHVCTPVETHADVTRAVLAAGAHAVVEKPLAPDERTTVELLALSTAAGRLLVPVHQFLFQDGFRRVADRLPELGTIVDVGLVAATAGAQLTGADADAVADEILPHPLALFERLLPSSTHGPWRASRPAPGELRASAVSGETTLWIAITTRGRPTRNELVVTGTAATAHVDLFHGFAVVEGGGPTRASKLARPFLRGSATLARAGANATRRAIRRETAYPGLRRLIEETYAAVADARPAPIAPDETRAVAAARDAILQASTQPTGPSA